MPTLFKIIIILGDFNGQIGKRRTQEDKVLGPYTTGKRNDNGQRRINFVLENYLHIIKSYTTGLLIGNGRGCHRMAG